jgi:hypothetical protein
MIARGKVASTCEVARLGAICVGLPVGATTVTRAGNVNPRSLFGTRGEKGCWIVSTLLDMASRVKVIR